VIPRFSGVVAVLLAAFALAIFITGGFVANVAGFRLSSRSALPAAIGASVALLAWIGEAWRERRIAADLAALDSWLIRRATAIVVVIALVAGAIALRYNTYSASGSDASGYLTEAAMLWSGELSRAEPRAAAATWFDGPATLAPLGWRAAADARQVPTYPVGLALAMAPLEGLSGIIAACALVPLLFAVAIAVTGATASRLGGGMAGLVAAVWLATSPIALYESLQPMSDIPVTAAWLVCWWLCIRGTVALAAPLGDSRAMRASSRPLLAGFAGAAAVLIRPNLAPLAALPALYLLLADRQTSTRARVQRAIAFSIPIAAAGFAIAYLQQRWFGSPLRSGYGSAQEIYSRSNFAPNVALYTNWLVATHGPWLLAAPVVWLWPGVTTFGRPRLCALRWLLLFAALVCAAYLFYSVFETWAYLRFLLPALAVAMIAVGALVFAPLARAPVVRAPLVIVIAFTLAASNLRASRQLHVFRLAEGHARAPLAGRYLEPLLPPNAVIICGEQRGALRYYTGRSVLRWDLAPPAALAEAIDRLVASGDDLWIALDEWEEELYRRKLPGAHAGALDWPPVAEAGIDPRTRVWRLRDRDHFMRGETIRTDRLR
jgi:hypothetical protein